MIVAAQSRRCLTILPSPQSDAATDAWLQRAADRYAPPEAQYSCDGSAALARDNSPAIRRFDPDALTPRTDAQCSDRIQPDCPWQPRINKDSLLYMKYKLGCCFYDTVVLAGSRPCLQFR